MFEQVNATSHTLRSEAALLERAISKFQSDDEATNTPITDGEGHPFPAPSDKDSPAFASASQVVLYAQFLRCAHKGANA